MQDYFWYLKFIILEINFNDNINNFIICCCMLLIDIFNSFLTLFLINIYLLDYNSVFVLTYLLIYLEVDVYLLITQLFNLALKCFICDLGISAQHMTHKYLVCDLLLEWAQIFWVYLITKQKYWNCLAVKNNLR
jgi:hypothetical protein